MGNDGPRDLVLDHKHVGELAIISFGSQVGTVCRSDELALLSVAGVFVALGAALVLGTGRFAHRAR